MLKCCSSILPKKHSTILRHLQMDLYYILWLNFKFLSHQIKWKRNSILYLNYKFSMFPVVFKTNHQFKLITTTLLFSKLFKIYFGTKKKRKNQFLRNTDVNLHELEQHFSAFISVNKEFGLTLLKLSYFPHSGFKDTEYISTIQNFNMQDQCCKHAQ